MYRTFFSALVLALSVAVLPASEVVYWEGEQPVETNFNEDCEFTAGELGEQAGLLSAGNWLTHKHIDDLEIEEPVIFAYYTITVEQSGRYHLWCRKFWSHGPFEWRFDEAPEWQHCHRRIPLTNRTPLLPNIEADWCLLGHLKLDKGTHRFQLKLDGPRKEGGMVASGLDKFALIRGSGKPQGKEGIEVGAVGLACDVSPRLITDETSLTVTVFGAEEGSSCEVEFHFQDTVTRQQLVFNAYDAQCEIPFVCNKGGPYEIRLLRNGEFVKSITGSAFPRDEQGKPLNKAEASAYINAVISELQQPLDMSDVLWKRHMDVAKYFAFLFEMNEHDDEHIQKNLDKRVAKYVDLIPRTYKWLNAMKQGKDLLGTTTGSKREAYISKIDGRAHPYTVNVPAAYTPDQPWPLVVNLHGSTWWCDLPKQKEVSQAYIMVKVDARGVNGGYFNLAESDVLAVLAEVQKHYSIDTQRVYLLGNSMGGGGTWSIASRYPDLFAAVIPAAGYVRKNCFSNFSHLPLLTVHGRKDSVVSSDYSYFGTRYLQQLGYPTRALYSGQHGHDIESFLFQEEPINWLLSHRRSLVPANLDYTTDSAQRGKYYWAKILQFVDPSEQARIRIQVRADNRIYVSAENVDQLDLQLPAEHLSSDVPVRIQGLSWSHTLPTPIPQTIRLQKHDEGFVVIPWVAAQLTQARRPYERGAMGLLYGNEPLLIVQGSKAEGDVLTAMEEFAEELTIRDGSWRRAHFPFLRLKKDTEVSEEDLQTHNLILVGGPDQNSVSARLSAAMPLFQKENTLTLSDDHSYELAGKGYTMLACNPEQQQRLVYLIGSSEAEFYNLGRPSISWGMDKGLSTDIMIEDVQSGQLERCFSYGHDWQIQPRFLHTTGLPAFVSHLEGICNKVTNQLHQKTGADFVVLASNAWASPFPAFNPAAACWDDINSAFADVIILEFFVDKTELNELVTEMMETAGVHCSLRSAMVSGDARNRYKVVTTANSIWAINGKMKKTYNMDVCHPSLKDLIFESFKR